MEASDEDAIVDDDDGSVEDEGAGAQTYEEAFMTEAAGRKACCLYL